MRGRSALLQLWAQHLY